MIRHFTGDEGFMNYEYLGPGTDGVEEGSPVAVADAPQSAAEVDYGGESLHWSNRVRKSGTRL